MFAKGCWGIESTTDPIEKYICITLKGSSMDQDKPQLALSLSILLGLN